MASLLRRSAAPARRLLALPRHLAAPASGPAASRSLSRHHPRDDRFNPRATPANWGVSIVPERNAFVVERFGKYLKTLDSGIHFLIPVLDRIAHVHSLKQEVLCIRKQEVTTKDNIPVTVDGAVYFQIVDPYLASYGVENPIYAVLQLAKTTMINELGKITLDKIFEDRDTLSEKMVTTINLEATCWGLECLCYEMKNITPLEGFFDVARRAMILESECNLSLEKSISWRYHYVFYIEEMLLNCI